MCVITKKHARWACFLAGITIKFLNNSSNNPILRLSYDIYDLARHHDDFLGFPAL